MRWFRKVARECGGAEIAEAAAVLPLVFMLLLGIYWFGRAYNIYATITHAAREGTRVAAARSCATCGSPDAQVTADQIADTVAQSLLAARLDPNQVSQPSPKPVYCGCNDPNCTNGPVDCTLPSGGEPQVCIQRDVLLTNSGTGPACGIAVSFQYPYQFYFPFTSMNQQQINLKAHSQMQGEN